MIPRFSIYYILLVRSTPPVVFDSAVVSEKVPACDGVVCEVVSVVDNSSGVFGPEVGCTEVPWEFCDGKTIPAYYKLASVFISDCKKRYIYMK